MLGHKYQCCIPLLTIGYNVGPQISMLYTIINYWYQCIWAQIYQCCIPLLTIGYNVGPQISMLVYHINYWV